MLLTRKVYPIAFIDKIFNCFEQLSFAKKKYYDLSAWAILFIAKFLIFIGKFNLHNDGVVSVDRYDVW